MRISSSIDLNAPVRGAGAPDDTIDECYRRSAALLERNTTPAGILAATTGPAAGRRRYTNIFGRDAAICALGMVASGDPSLMATARRSLVTLARHQAPNGQLPKFVTPDTGEADFWYTGCIDATLWWLIAVHYFDCHVENGLLGKELDVQVLRALRWLFCQEHQRLYLLQQNEASDWADIMPRSGFVLYTNALWYWVKTLYRLPNQDQTRQCARLLFYPFDNRPIENRRARILVHYIRQKAKPTGFWLSFVNFSFWGEEIDIFGNILAALTGLMDASRVCRITDALIRMKADEPYPIRVVASPVGRGSPLWRPFMERHRQNLPGQYHNGGIWPFVGGFWALLLERIGMPERARAVLARLACANRVNRWEFNEWFHGRTRAPMGMAGQSWNAALFLLAYQVLAGKTVFDPQPRHSRREKGLPAKRSQIERSSECR